MCDFGWPWLSQQDKERILDGMELGTAVHPPRAVQIDWTDRCNLGCFFCSQREVRRTDELDRLALEILFDELDALGVSSIQVAGGGEPLFHRHISEVLDSIRLRHGFTIGTLVTNGLALTKRIRQKVLETVGNRLIISLNAFGEKDYGYFTGASEGTYHRVVENIREFVALKRKTGRSSPRVWVQFLVHDETVPLMPAMLERARELGVDALIFNPIHNYGEWSRSIGERPDWFLDHVHRVFMADCDALIEDVQTVHPTVNRAILHLREAEFASRYSEVVARHRRYMNLEAHCPLPWYFMHIKATGSVYPCCFLIRPGQAPAGSIHTESLNEIWNGRPFSVLRQGMAGLALRARGEPIGGSSPDGLPKLCVDGTCMIRHLPYIDDGEFYSQIDCLGRAPVNRCVRFPGRMDPESPCSIDGRYNGEAATVEIRVNHQPTGRTAVVGGRFSFSFLPRGLEDGFHLLEVVGDDGRAFAAARVEVVRQGE